MNSTVNGIRREQKKLRHCIRSYKKKLHGDQKITKPFKFGWIANTSADDDFDRREIDLSPNVGKLTQQQTILASDKEAILQNREIPIAKASIVPPINPLQAQVDAFLKAPNIKLKKKTNENEKANKGNKTKVGRERRKFVIGSGKIRSSERTMRDVFHGEDADDTFSLLSDSSDEERRINTSPDANQDRYKSIKRLRDASAGLIRSNSAYFKPINMSDHGDPTSKENLTDDHPSNKHITEIASSDQKHLDLSSDKAIQISSHVSDNKQSQLNDYQNTDGSTNKPCLPPILPIYDKEGTVVKVVTKESGKQSRNNDKIRISRRKKSSPKEKKGISFGDIAKLQHGLKTKKLFSLVDQLAAQNGLVGDISTLDSTKQLTRSKSMKKRIFITNPSDGGNLSLTQYSSVFYPMKYGYEFDASDSTEETHVPVNSTLKAKDDVSATLLSVTDSGIDSEPTTNLSTKLSHIDINGNALNDSLEDNSSTSPLSYSAKKINTTISGTEVSGPSPLLDQDDINRTVQEIQALQRHRGSRYLRQRRRSSMLEASQFVKSLRDKGSDKKDGDKKMSFSMEMGSFDKRRESVIDDDENEMVPDIHKVPWSSALRSIKLVHTLADLTHII